MDFLILVICCLLADTEAQADRKYQSVNFIPFSGYSLIIVDWFIISFVAMIPNIYLHQFVNIKSFHTFALHF